MRVYTFPQLEAIGRLGNQLYQVAGTLSLAARDPQGHARAYIPDHWRYRRLVSLPDASYARPDPTDEVIDAAHESGGPYFQQLRYISHVPVRDYFAPSELGERMLRAAYTNILDSQRHTTALHVRRTDYLKHPDRFPQLTRRYYEEAVARAIDAEPSTLFLVFSDDIPWCRGNADELGLRPFPHQFIEGYVAPVPPRERGTADILDLWLMAGCDAHIIANSSYSWWAAYLSEQNLVFYPDRWFGPDADGYSEMWNAFPPSWTQLPC